MMENSKFKKTILIFFMFIFILAIILGIKILSHKNNVNSKFKNLSATEIKEKIIKGLNYNNFTISYKKNEETIIKKVKDGIIVVISPSTGTYGWYDSNNRVAIAGNTIKNKYEKINVVDDSLFNRHFLPIEMTFEEYGDDLYHIRDENYHNKKCHVIEADEDRSETYWIDAENGFVEKYESTTDGTKIEFSFELDNVTDDDIKKPIL